VKTKTIEKWLVVASDGAVRVAGVRGPARLKAHEVAFRLTIRIPDTWGKVQPGELTLTLPEPPEVATVEAAGPPEMAEVSPSE
jgi:hypothetical protein